MKKIIILIMFVITISCSSNNLQELNNMTDWNKSEISNKTSDEMRNLANNFIIQRDKDLEILKFYNLENNENGLNLIDNWNSLIGITETIYKTKLVGKLQVIKRKILINEINKLKLDINKDIEVKYGKKNSL